MPCHCGRFSGGQSKDTWKGQVLVSVLLDSDLRLSIALISNTRALSSRRLAFRD